MANKKNLLGMLAIALIFGMTVVGCEGDPEDKDTQTYVGEWTGKFKNGAQEEDATMILTDTEWVLTSESVNLSGTYAKVTIGVDFSMVMNSGPNVVADIKVASGVAVGNLLTVTFNSILPAYSGAHSFSRVKETPPTPPATDPFIGTWTGTLTSIGTPAATIVLTGTGTWTLTVGETIVNGTYTKSGLGFSATLKVADDITYGTCSSSNEKLTVFFTNGTYIGSRGNFTRVTP
jgi:hypothetical protein